MWIEPEEKTLGRAWVDVSEDPTVGNDQSGQTFWRKVTHRFLAEMGRGPYRTKDQIYTKWRNMNKVVMEFNGLFMNMKRSWPSGANDEVIANKAREVFRNENNNPFKYQGFWEVVRSSRKWCEIFSSEDYTSGTKRSKSSEKTYTTSGSEAHFDLNDDEEGDFSPPAARMMGRDKAKQKGKRVASSARGVSSDELQQVQCTLEGLQTNVKSLVDIEHEKIKSRELLSLMKDTSHYTPEEREIALLVKAELRKKYFNQ